MHALSMRLIRETSAGWSWTSQALSDWAITRSSSTRAGAGMLLLALHSPARASVAQRDSSGCLCANSFTTSPAIS